MRSAWILAALVTMPVLAGCATTDGPTPSSPTSTRHVTAPRPEIEEVSVALGAPIEMDHDHRDPLVHAGARNLKQIAWSPLGVTLGVNGFANFVFYQDEDEDLVFIAVDGDTRGGMVIADISDPASPKPLGRYMVDGNNVQEVRVFPGGRYAVINMQTIPSQQNTPSGVEECGVCMHILDVRDRAHPTYVSSYPVDLLGTHNMDIHEIGGVVYLFYVGQPLTNAPPGNYVGIARFVESPTGAYLVKVGEYRLATAATQQGQSFPHDVMVQENPVTKQTIMYVSHWQGGLVTVDVTQPLAARQLGVYDDPAPSEVNNIHWTIQENRTRNGTLVAWSAPEIGQLKSGSGVIRAYDVTDPAAPKQIGTWTLPGNVTIPSRYIFSPHTVAPDLDRGIMAVAHYHAGVWVLDITDPTKPLAVAYAFPVGNASAPYDGAIWWKKPNFSPDGFFPNVFQVRWHEPDGTLWVSERGSGLYAYEYTGPIPGRIG